jgi:hypothetical protein
MEKRMDPINLPTSSYYLNCSLELLLEFYFTKRAPTITKGKDGINHFKAHKSQKKKLFFGGKGIYVWWLQFKEFLEIMLQGNLKSV